RRSIDRLQVLSFEVRVSDWEDLVVIVVFVPIPIPIPITTAPVPSAITIIAIVAVIFVVAVAAVGNRAPKLALEPVHLRVDFAQLIWIKAVPGSNVKSALQIVRFGIEAICLVRPDAAERPLHIEEAPLQVLRAPPAIVAVARSVAVPVGLRIILRGSRRSERKSCASGSNRQDEFAHEGA